jgi:hypothetical protein
VRRSRDDAERHISGVSKLDRATLSLTEKGKLKRAAETGLEEKFTMIEPLIGTKPTKEQLQSIYSVTMRIEEFRRSLQAFDMEDVFVIANEYDIDATSGDYKPATGSRPINLFTSIQDVDLNTLKNASAFSTHYGQEFVLENLLWSGAKLLNSCDDKLRQKLEERTLGWTVEYMTGPVFFKIMLETILASSPESLRGLTTLIQTTTLKDFDGENVIEFVSFARGAMEQLRNNAALPIDILSILANALKQCETPDFVSYITSMYNNHVQGVKDCSPTDLLSNAETEYIAMVTSKKWQLGTAESQESVFFAGDCYGCGQHGHRQGDPICPKSKTGTPGRGRGGHGRGRGRGGFRGGRATGGRGRGDGRGGRGTGGRGFIEKDRTPPKANEPHTRVKNNRTEKWCGRCSYWTWADKAHETPDCPFNRAGANLAVDAGNTPPATDGEAHLAVDSTDPISTPNGFTGLVYAADF